MPQFFRALAYATDHGIGRPTQMVDLTSTGASITVVTGVPASDHYTPTHAHAQEH